MPSPLRIAVAGLGFMGATHIRAWHSVAGAELAGVVSANPRKLSGDLSGTGGNLAGGETQFDFTGVKRFSTLEAALDDSAIDAVDLCLPTHLHADAGLAALSAGKHVFLEKPIARTSAQAYTLIAEAERRGLILMAGHVLRFFPEWRELKRQLQHSPARLASFRRNCGRPAWSSWSPDVALSGGAPLDLLIHDTDFVLHCFGTPAHISAVGVEDHAAGIDWLSARCTFPHSGPVQISGGWHPSPHYPFSMEFTAITKGGTLDWSSAGRPLTWFPTQGDSTVLPLTSVPDPWAAQLQHFADSIRSGSPPHLSPPAESAAAVRFVEIMVESRKRNGETLPWTL